MYNIKRKKKGISPVIASIILIAITIAVAIAVAGWVFGLFGTYGTAGGVTVINPTLSSTTDTFAGTVKNDRDTSVDLVSVTATGDGGIAVTFTTGSGPFSAHTSTTMSETGTPIGSFTAGSSYVVKVSFTDGTIASVSVVAS
ncbi:MAG: hypothetical protein H3Z53_09685 [archaeon]|nr:hypothetical protein [archaeon]